MDHRPQSPCAPWDRFWVLEPSCRPSVPAQSVPAFETHEEKRGKLRLSWLLGKRGVVKVAQLKLDPSNFLSSRDSLHFVQDLLA